MNQRKLSPVDTLLTTLDNGLRTIFGSPTLTERPNPTEGITETELEAGERELAGRLMRINHAGEVSAQGLYQGQALTAKLPEVREKMERAALEENDHLEWCERRIHELGTHKSLLNPLWYLGSLTIGALAGAAGDKWSLGFVAETEHQVIRHLDEHLAQVSQKDQKTCAILEHMKEDESHHATVALQHGGAQLPWPVRKLLMPIMSKLMTKGAYWI